MPRCGKSRESALFYLTFFLSSESSESIQFYEKKVKKKCLSRILQGYLILHLDDPFELGKIGEPVRATVTRNGRKVDIFSFRRE